MSLKENDKYKEENQELLEHAMAEYINSLTDLKKVLDKVLESSEERNDVYKSSIKILTDFIK